MKTALLLACVLACGCAKSTELLVVVSSDLVLPDEADTLRLEISRADTGAPIFSQVYPLGSPMALPASLDLHGSRSAPTVSMLAQLERKGVAVVNRRATVPFEPDRALALRVGLDRICLGSMCAGNTTCSGGVCVPIDVPPSDLEPVGGDPGAPHDMRVDPPFDFSFRPDLSVRHDLSSGPDLLSLPDMACAAPLTPTADQTCKTFQFASGMLPTGLKLSPSDATITYECGRMNIHVPAGTHSRSTALQDVRIALANEFMTPATGPFRVVAGYDVEAQGVSWAGVEARSESSFESGETRPSASTGANDLLELREDASMPKIKNLPSAGRHELELKRTATIVGSGQTAWIYDLMVDSIQSLVSNPSYTTSSVVRSFVVGNDAGASLTPNNAIDVHLSYLQFCPQ